jgi:hypothetical protein
LSPKAERSLAMPRWRIGWDVLLWMGFRRFKRHWSVSQIQGELWDSYTIQLSQQTITDYLRTYQLMVAARHQDMANLRHIYHTEKDVMLSIDGLQPEKGHETLYVVRELRRDRVWFAEPLLSSTHDEVRKVIHRAKTLAGQLKKSIRGWVSDKQGAFVTTIAEECPGVPHRYCNNHFLRDLAKLTLDKDSHAKVHMRQKIRGLRRIEKDTLAEGEQASLNERDLTQAQHAYAAQIVLDYCAAVRGILNDNHGGPLTPPGWRMAQALETVCLSLERNVTLPLTPIRGKLQRLSACIQRGVALYNHEKPDIAAEIKAIQQVFDTLNPDTGSQAERLATFRQLKEQFGTDTHPVKVHMSTIMESFETGLFVGSDDKELPGDNLELERWIKTPKGHERRIHGRQHVGLRLVYEGPTLVPAVDAHRTRTTPFLVQELLPYVDIHIPESQRRAVERHRIMTKASSKKNEGNS